MMMMRRGQSVSSICHRQRNRKFCMGLEQPLQAERLVQGLEMHGCSASFLQPIPTSAVERGIPGEEKEQAASASAAVTAPNPPGTGHVSLPLDCCTEPPRCLKAAPALWNYKWL